MFEASLLPGRKGRDAKVVRWIAGGSVALQVAAVTAFVVVPLIHPDALPLVIRPARLTRVEMKRPEVKIIPLKPRVVPVTLEAVNAPAHLVQAVTETRQGGMISRAPVTDAEPLLALGGGSGPMGPGFNPNAGPGGLTGNGDSPVIVIAKPAVAAASAGPVRVSQGVSRGLLLDPIRPVYPPIAKQARVQGTVVVTAVIDRTGRIANAQVVDGPMMLREAAVTAVREARYKPYLLNGAPTEVVTTFSITFTMAG